MASIRFSIVIRTDSGVVERLVPVTSSAQQRHAAGNRNFTKTEQLDKRRRAKRKLSVSRLSGGFVPVLVAAGTEHTATRRCHRIRIAIK